jgi:hypothetical protein
LHRLIAEQNAHIYVCGYDSCGIWRIEIGAHQGCAATQARLDKVSPQRFRQS